MVWLTVDANVLFLTLGLLVFPSQIHPGYGRRFTYFNIFLIHVRPSISVFLKSRSFSKMKIERRFYISWVAVRGAVPNCSLLHIHFWRNRQSKHDLLKYCFLCYFAKPFYFISRKPPSLSWLTWLGVAIPEKAKKSYRQQILPVFWRSLKTINWGDFGFRFECFCY